MNSETYLVFDENEEQRKEDIYKRLKERQRSDLKKILDKSEGRRLLWRVLSEGRVFNSCYAVNALDMARMEGKRDNALWLLKEILSVSMESFTLMQKEAASDKLQMDAELEKQNKN